MVTEFRPTLENIRVIWNAIKDDAAFNSVFLEGLPKSEVSLITILQASHNAVVDMDAGWLLWTSDLIPLRDVRVHVISWKGDKNLVRSAQEALRLHVFQRLGVARVSAVVPEWNRAARLFALKVGMTKEGVIRDVYKKDGVLYSAHVFGITKKEAVG